MPISTIGGLRNLSMKGTTTIQGGPGTITAIGRATDTATDVVNMAATHTGAIAHISDMVGHLATTRTISQGTLLITAMADTLAATEGTVRTGDQGRPLGETPSTPAMVAMMAMAAMVVMVDTVVMEEEAAMAALVGGMVRRATPTGERSSF